MSSLNDSERRILEQAFGMASGCVLDFSRVKFADFFGAQGIDITNAKYQMHGESMAKRLRAFWLLEPDEVVGPVLWELLRGAKTAADLGHFALPAELYNKCSEIVERLIEGIAPEGNAEREFLARHIDAVAIDRLPFREEVSSIVERRLREAQLTLEAKAHLSTVFLCGSLLEAALLGAAESDPKRFNQASAAPTKDGKPLLFSQWKLAQLIDTAEQLGILKPDTKQFSHAMRDFRNYIHPAKEIEVGFTPDSHTARLCYQALMAAFADLAGDRVG